MNIETNFQEIRLTYPKIFRERNFDTIICESPLANCQTYSLSGISNIIKNDNLKDYLIQVQKIALKTQMLIDISTGYEHYIEKIFPEDEIIIKAPYINGTGNKMTLFLLRTRTLKSQNKAINTSIPEIETAIPRIIENDRIISSTENASLTLGFFKVFNPT